MHRQKLLHELETYFSSPIITREEIPFFDRFIEFIKANPDCFERSNIGHITSSAWIINHDGTQALLTHHKKFNVWVQLGGHNDGDPDCAAVALKEAEEESGIQGLKLVSPDIFDIDIHAIPNQCTYHYDVRYLIRAPRNAQYIVSDESHALAWVPLDRIEKFSKEASMIRMVKKFKNLALQ